MKLNQEEWGALCENLLPDAEKALFVWIEFGVEELKKTSLGVRLYSKEWDAVGKFLFTTNYGEEIFCYTDPFN